MKGGLGEHYHWKEHWTTVRDAVHVICLVSLGLYDREWSWKLEAQLLNHPSSPSRCVYHPSLWLTIRLRSWAPEYQYGSDSAGPLRQGKQDRLPSLWKTETYRCQGDQCKLSKKMLCCTKRQFDSLQNSHCDLEELHLWRFCTILALLSTKTDESIEGPSVGGEQNRNSNPFVFIICTVLRDVWLKKGGEGGGGGIVKSNGLAVLTPVIWNLRFILWVNDRVPLL